MAADPVVGGPEAVDAEEAVLGAMLLDGAAIGRVAEWLSPPAFVRESNRLLYAAGWELFRAGEPVDHVTVAAALGPELRRVGGVGRIALLTENTPTSANIEHYGRLVQGAARRRALIAAGRHSIELGMSQDVTADEAVSRAQAEHLGLCDEDRAGGLVRLGELVPQALERAEAHAAGAALAERAGVLSGLSDLDRLIGGFQPGDLVVIAARPSMGKTSLAMQIAVHAAAERGTPAAVFSLEMSRSSLVDRMLCERARVDAQRLSRGIVGDGEVERLISACGPLAAAPLWIDDSSRLEDVTLGIRARQARQRHGIGLVVVDYLQLLHGPRVRGDPNRVQEVSAITRGLKALARELDLPVIALSQLSRAPEARQDKRPILSDLRESGEIEQTADLVIGLYRDDYYSRERSEKPGVAEAIVLKHRNGPTGMVELLFRREYTRFENLARRGGMGGDDE